MRFIAPLLFACVFLFASCAKEEVDGFESKITYAYDFKVDQLTNDTFYRVYMPNAFTPDRDGINDYYIVYGTGWDPNGFEMTVFSREGNLVFFSNNPYIGFDGAVQGHGDLSAQQVYTVDVQITDTTGELHHYNYKIAAIF